MPKKFPSKHYLFLVADAVRQEANLKVSILGVFPAGDIRVAAGTPFPVTFPLAFWFVFVDGEGDFEAKVTVRDPSGATLVPPTPMGPPSHKGTAGPLQIVVNFPLITLPSPGKYTAEIILDDRAYSDSFTVNFA
jgi:hypothetical protein